MAPNRGPAVVFWEVMRACALPFRRCKAEAQPRRLPLEPSTDECSHVLDDLTTFVRPPPAEVYRPDTWWTGGHKAPTLLR